MEEQESKSVVEVEVKLRRFKALYDDAGGEPLNRKGDYSECGIGLCLLGMVRASGHNVPHLGIDDNKKLSLEAGFCGWPDDENTSFSKRDPEFYALGEKLALEWCP